MLAGKYQILKALGKGGEGSVWLAVHVQTEQLWAVKELPRKGNRQEFHELNMMRKLRHPSLPRILDVLETDTYIYLIMEYIRGYTLEEIKQKKGKLAPEQVLDIGMQLCGALCYLHGRKNPIFHLDIKPANIIRQKDGTLVLVDFGAARKYLDQEEEIEKRGTEGFAAPEQYDREKQVDGRTDIYGLGATMYYLVSGVRYSPALCKGRVPGCPEYLNDIIRTCVQKSAECRYQNSKKLCRELEKQKRKQDYAKQRCKIWAALLLIILSAGIAVRELQSEFAVQMEESWNYEKLLEEALCISWEESLDFYQRAVFLAPNRKEMYLQYLQEADRDGVFSIKEEEKLRGILHMIPLGQAETYEEMLEKNNSAYGEVAFRLGMLYWYDYKSGDGKRIAAGWFAKSQKALKKMPENRERQEWEKKAEVFAHMSTYYEQLGKWDETGEKGNLAKEYWEDLNTILEIQEEDPSQQMMELQFLNEAVGRIIFLAEQLWQSGISQEELVKVMEYMTERTKELVTEESKVELEQKLKAEILTQVEAARAVIANLEEKTDETDAAS